MNILNKYLSFAAVILLALTSVSHAAPIGAKAMSVEGEVFLLSIEDGKTRQVIRGDAFTAGDKITTGPDGKVVILFDTGSRMTIDNDTEMTIKNLSKNDRGKSKSIFGIGFGRVRAFVAKMDSSSKFEYHTKAAIAGVGGTVYAVDAGNKNDATTRVYNLCEEVETGGGDTPAKENGCIVYVVAQGKTVLLEPHFETRVIFGSQPADPTRTTKERFEFLNEIMPFQLFFGPDVMVEHLSNIVSVPIIKPDGTDPSNENLELGYEQGNGLLGYGASSPSSSLVTGSVTVTTTH